MDIDLSVQVSTHNRKNVVVETIKAIFDQDYPKDKYEIIIVDDGSTDGTSEAIQALRPPCKFVFEKIEHSGIARARNKGIELSRGSIVLFLDDDMIPSRQMISGHMKVHKEFPDSVVKGWVNHVDDMDNIDTKTPKFIMKDYASAFFLGGNGSVSKKHLVEAGKFDEIFTEYGWEDLELGYRLRRLGLKSRYSPEAVGYHYKPVLNKADLPVFYKRAASKGRTAVLFLQKHSNWRVKLATGIYFPRIVLNDIVKFIGKSLFTNVVKKSPDGELKGFALFCAHQLYKFEYFKAIKDSFKKKQE